MSRIKKNDKVKVLAGKDKGKTGKVLQMFSKSDKALVEGINLIKKHVRKTREDKPSGVISKENRICMSKLMLICPSCNKGTRVGYRFLADKSKVRYCKRCQEVI